MNEKCKDDFFAGALIAGSGFGFGSLFYWVFNWAWWISFPLGLVLGFFSIAFLAVLPLILWGIIGD